ncbi:photoactive yellow protein [Spirosoma aureum]|uniref:Photoactive yellow protein n=1 Tax=Spirosoma aureum TaxID=2692134 RepID=A0A6G9AUA0_9BACT|nr:photoactive yellow protein [Spirosoma aureum]QIP15968.1 photoactive yellow protein [Spirosoma aureum]
MNKILTFSDQDLLESLEQQTHEQVEEAPFGLVRMSREGIVVAYGKLESYITGISKEYALGKYYFTQIAPCANNRMIAAKFAQPALDEELDYILTYVSEPVKVRLRLLKSPTSRYQYFLVNLKAVA